MLFLEHSDSLYMRYLCASTLFFLAILRYKQAKPEA